MNLTDTVRSCILLEFRKKNNLCQNHQISVFSWLSLCLLCRDEDLLKAYICFSIDRLRIFYDERKVSKKEYQLILLSAMRLFGSSNMVSLSCKKDGLLLFLSATQLVLVGTNQIAPNFYSPLEYISVDNLGSPDIIITQILGKDSLDTLSSFHPL